MKVTTCNGEANIMVLPDSEADICAAGPQVVRALGEHMDNLAHSNVTPRAVNSCLLGKIPDATFYTHGSTTKEEVHIYVSIMGTIILWAAAHRLSILPRCYPQPMTNIVTAQLTLANNSWNLSPHTVDQIRSISKTPTTIIDDFDR